MLRTTATHFLAQSSIVASRSRTSLISSSKVCPSSQGLDDRTDSCYAAHGGLKGTTRPTHYFVVHDENGFHADDLQRLTNDLSYMFERATKAVSLVSPAYWADVACERGRCYLHKLLHGDKDGGGAEAAKESKGKKGKERAGDPVFERAEGLWGNGVSGPRLRDTMFYL